MDNDFELVDIYLEDENVYPTEYDTLVNELMVTVVDNEEKDLIQYGISLEDEKAYYTGVYCRDAYRSPDGLLVLTNAATPLIFVEDYDVFDAEQMSVKGVLFTDDIYLLPHNFNKIGSYMLVSRLYQYSRQDPREETETYFRLFYVDTNTWEYGEFISNFFDNFEANFRRGTNELVFTSDLS